jgi:electron transfer flavoprotein beta subunit
MKQIPDPAEPYSLDPATNFLVRPDDQVLDDTDRYGVEMGLQLAGEDGTVTLVSMGPGGNMQGIRQALAMGASEAIVVSDEALRGCAALGTAKVLAAAIGRREYDLVITGTESTDGYSGIVPQQLAELLDLPALTYARKVEVIDGMVKVEQQTLGGFNQVEAGMPALVSVTAGVVEPRYPTFKGIMAAKSKPVEVLVLADLDIDAAGVADAGQEILSVEAAPARAAGTKIEDDGEGHIAIVEKLRQLKVVS